MNIQHELTKLGMIAKGSHEECRIYKGEELVATTYSSEYGNSEEHWELIQKRLNDKK